MKIDLKEERVEVSFSVLNKRERDVPFSFVNPIKSHSILQKKYLTSLFRKKNDSNSLFYLFIDDFLLF